MSIMVYVQHDGKIVIRWPKGQMPDSETISHLYKVISANATSAPAA